MTAAERIAADLNIEVGLLVREMVPLIRAHRELTGEAPDALLKAALLEVAEEDPALMGPASGDREALDAAPPADRVPAPAPDPDASDHVEEPEVAPTRPLEPRADPDSRFAHLSVADLLEQAEEDERVGMGRDARDKRAEIRIRGEAVPEPVPEPEPEPEPEPAPAPDPPGGRERPIAWHGNMPDHDEAREVIREKLADAPTSKSALAVAIGYSGLSPGAHAVIDRIFAELQAIPVGKLKGGILYGLPPTAEDLAAFAQGDDVEDPPSDPSPGAAPAPDAEPSEPPNSPSAESPPHDGDAIGVPCPECGQGIAMGVADADAPSGGFPVQVGHAEGCPLAGATDSLSVGGTDSAPPPTERYPAASPESNAKARAKGQTIALEPAPQRNMGMGTLADDNAPAKASGPPLSARVRREMEREAKAPKDPAAAPFPPSGNPREDQRRAAMAAKVMNLLRTQPMTIPGIAANLFRSRDDVGLIVSYLQRAGWIRNTPDGYEHVPEDER